ncbi:Egln1, partial [Symbiodinium pilosum]
AHFKHLEASDCRLCLYQNYEAVPQEHTLTPFVDVTLFKVPSGRVSKTPAGMAGMNFWAQRTKARNYFLYYDNGKSAVRVRGKPGSEIAPTSVHLLYPPDDLEELITGKHAWTNFAPHELPDMNLTWLASSHEEVVAAAKVLHYPATHFERLWRKYNHLGNFPSVRFGGDLVVPPSFHLEARDEYLKHSTKEKQLEKLKELLEKAAFLRGDAEVQSQLETGSVVIIDTVRESLRQGIWVPPRQLRQSVFKMLQRRPGVKGMERLQTMKRRPAEVCFAGQGGILKNLDSALDEIVQSLCLNGWVACDLGAHQSLIARALEEAKTLKPRMSRGTTVIQNEIISPNTPNADREDKVLFLQEQGLSGPSAAKGPAPTIALLESAVIDIVMHLDPRLQRSQLQLRITERCDGMLSSYEKGGAYSAHIDNADGDGRVDGRVLTAVLYLNVGWDRYAGGELAIFQPELGDIGDANCHGKWNMVYPEAGTLVFLRADHVLHEVRGAHAERYALSVWFCGQHSNYGGS